MLTKLKIVTFQLSFRRCGFANFYTIKSYIIVRNIWNQFGQPKTFLRGLSP